MRYHLTAPKIKDEKCIIEFESGTLLVVFSKDKIKKVTKSLSLNRINQRKVIFLKIVIVKSPKIMRGFFRLFFGIKKED